MSIKKFLNIFSGGDGFNTQEALALISFLLFCATGIAVVWKFIVEGFEGGYELLIVFSAIALGKSVSQAVSQRIQGKKSE